MKKIIGLRGFAPVAMGVLLFLSSCNDDKVDFSSKDSSNVENEASTDGYFEDADDISSVAVWSDDATAGRQSTEGRKRKITLPDLRCSCATVIIEPDSLTSEIDGNIIIDFGTGCTDSKGNTRKGKILVAYNGLRYAVGSTRTITFDSYFINEVQIEGLRNVTNIAGSTDENPKFKIEVIGGKATWPDGTSATREVRKIREWQRAANPLNDMWTISQDPDSDFAASGTNRNGKTYQMNITTPLVYKRECAVSAKVFMAVQGEKKLITDTKEITINYGTGDCDRNVVITVNGKSEDVSVTGSI
jgi:hypothetical protein